MIKRVLKIFGVIIGAIIIYIVGITIWLYSMIHYYEESKDSVPLVIPDNSVPVPSMLQTK